MSEAGESPDTAALLAAWRDGDPRALGQLVPLVYDELRRLAHGYLRRERPDHTLETSALIHEAYLRLAGQRLECGDRGYFFAIAARTMRRILVEHARGRGYQKRGGGARRVALDQALTVAAAADPDLAALDQALARLQEVSPAQAQVVELRFFGGLSWEEIAQALGISVATATRRWRVARSWLYRCLTSGEEAADG